MKAKESGGFTPVKLPMPQTTVARCYSIIHFGTVPNIFNGVLKGEVEKIYITWEMPLLKAVFNEDRGPEPFVVGEEVTLSTNENSNLSKLIAQMRGRPLTKEEQKGFDPSKMVGKTCLINFMHKTKKKFLGERIDEITNANTMLVLNSMLPRPESMECPPQINPSYIWDWEPIVEGKKPFDAEYFGKMPKWLQEKVMQSKEFKKYGAQYIKSEPTSSDDNDSDNSVEAPPVSDGNW